MRRVTNVSSEAGLDRSTFVWREEFGLLREVRKEEVPSDAKKTGRKALYEKDSDIRQNLLCKWTER
jgi:hypothetical protein